MFVDRYAKAVLTVIAIAVFSLAVQSLVSWPIVGKAVSVGRAQAQTEAPKYEVTIPKSWGKYVGYSNNNLLLQTPDGTMRIVDVEGKAPEYPKVKVLIHWQ